MRHAIARAAYAAHCLLFPRHAERQLRRAVRKNLRHYRDGLRTHGLQANTRANWRG
jgi:hypothetical protein